MALQLFKDRAKYPDGFPSDAKIISQCASRAVEILKEHPGALDAELLEELVPTNLKMPWH